METTHKIAHAIIVNEIAKNINHELKFTKQYKGLLKNRLNLLLLELRKCEPEYDLFFNTIEETTVEVYNEYDLFIKAVASVPIWDSRNVRLIIEAYNKDPKALEGIVNKILKL